MRTSTYEIILPIIGEDGKAIADHVLLMNGLYGAMDVVKTEEAEKLRAGDIASLPLSLKERLALRGHITRKDEGGELSDLALLSRIYKTLFGRGAVALVIMPTYDCNFRCPYCFEQHRLKKGQDWLNSTMSEETITAVFAALADYKKRGYELGNCSLYGGEPLLAKNLATVEKIVEHARELGMTISATTNGYDLASYVDFFDEYKVSSLQITVDGTAETNNRRRIHKDGLPTYDRIIENVELALAHGVDVTLRVNVGKDNLTNIGVLMDDLKARGLLKKDGKCASFVYYFKAAYDDAHPENNVAESDIIEELVKYGLTLDEAMDLHSNYSGISKKLLGSFAKEEFPSFSPAFCGSEQGMMVVDPFGKVYSCWDAVGIEGNVVGTIDLETGRFLWNFDKAKWRTRTVDLMENCRRCPYAFICRGGCAARAKNAYGDYFCEFCGEMKEIFDFVASRVVGKEWEENHGNELTLSLAGPVSRLTEKERETIMKSRSQKEILMIAKAAGIIGDSVSIQDTESPVIHT